MLKTLAVLISYLLMILVNALANLLPINGITTGEISNKLDVIFTPAGYVFSIWSLIYVLLGLWVARQFLPKNKDKLIYEKTSTLFIISSLLNSVWIVLWHYFYFSMTVLVMVSLLYTLILLYHQINRYDGDLFDRATFSIYLGWISVATIANISYALVYYDWNQFGFSAEAWTYLMLVIATGLAIWFLFKNNDALYPLVFVWAFFGIAVRNTDRYDGVAMAAALLAAIIFTLVVGWRWVHHRQAKK